MISAIEAATACYYDAYNSEKDKGGSQLSSSVANSLISANDFTFHLYVIGELTQNYI